MKLTKYTYKDCAVPPPLPKLASTQIGKYLQWQSYFSLAFLFPYSGFSSNHVLPVRGSQNLYFFDVLFLLLLLVSSPRGLILFRILLIASGRAPSIPPPRGHDVCRHCGCLPWRLLGHDKADP